jgi:hypothetical protein
MENPFDTDKMSSEDLRTYREVMTIRARNSERVAKIESHGRALEIATARVEHILSSLVSLEVLTLAQCLAIQKDWELTLRAQTKAILQSLDAEAAEKAKEAARPKLYVPGR